MFSHTGMCALLLAQVDSQPTGFQQFIASMMPLILVFVIMYLLLIRPQQKKASQHREMVNRLKAGDEIVTSGGIRGTITGVKDKFFTVKIADKVEIEVTRSSVSTILGKEA